MQMPSCIMNTANLPGPALWLAPAPCMQDAGPLQASPGVLSSCCFTCTTAECQHALLALGTFNRKLAARCTAPSGHTRGRLYSLSSSELVTTETEDRAMAAAATQGGTREWVTGYRAPAARGIATWNVCMRGGEEKAGEDVPELLH
jgi:hypothetical protein